MPKYYDCYINWIFTEIIHQKKFRKLDIVIDIFSNQAIMKTLFTSNVLWNFHQRY